jgi:hypothetical protein
MTLVLNASNDILFFLNSKSKDILITPQTRLKASQVERGQGQCSKHNKLPPPKQKQRQPKCLKHKQQHGHTSKTENRKKKQNYLWKQVMKTVFFVHHN